MTGNDAPAYPLGVSVPLGGPLGAQRDRIRDLVSWGNTHEQFGAVRYGSLGGCFRR